MPEQDESPYLETMCDLARVVVLFVCVGLGAFVCGAAYAVLKALS